MAAPAAACRAFIYRLVRLNDFRRNTQQGGFSMTVRTARQANSTPLGVCVEVLLPPIFRSKRQLLLKILWPQKRPCAKSTQREVKGVAGCFYAALKHMKRLKIMGTCLKRVMLRFFGSIDAVCQRTLSLPPLAAWRRFRGAGWVE